jgi:hypothetical protein
MKRNIKAKEEEEEEDMFAMNNSIIKEKCTPIRNKAPTVLEIANKDLQLFTDFQITRSTSPAKVPQR